MWFTRSTCTRSKIILRIVTRCGELRGNPKATVQTTEYLVYRSQRWSCRMHGDKITSQSWLRCSKNISIRNNSLRTWVKGRRLTGSARNHKNYSIPQNINIPIASFSEIGIIYCSCGRNLMYSRSFTTLQKTNFDFTSILGFGHWEEFQSRTKTWCHWKTGDVLQGGTDA